MLVLLAAASVAPAQNRTDSPPRDTNSAGTAQSSGPARNREPGVTTGSAPIGSGRAATNPSMSPDEAINAENNTIDRKLKGICRGC
jgi:hypothetical protein